MSFIFQWFQQAGVWAGQRIGEALWGVPATTTGDYPEYTPPLVTAVTGFFDVVGTWWQAVGPTVIQWALPIILVVAIVAVVIVLIYFGAKMLIPRLIEEFLGGD